eukprot:m.379911 g.379911  ORF g.379911 m.379911 type:complete len:2042 (+) comp20032_c0_seq3:38-6163(+)
MGRSKRLLAGNTGRNGGSEVDPLARVVQDQCLPLLNTDDSGPLSQQLREALIATSTTRLRLLKKLDKQLGPEAAPSDAAAVLAALGHCFCDLGCPQNFRRVSIRVFGALRAAAPSALTPVLRQAVHALCSGDKGIAVCSSAVQVDGVGALVTSLLDQFPEGEVCVLDVLGELATALHQSLSTWTAPYLATNQDTSLLAAAADACQAVCNTLATLCQRFPAQLSALPEFSALQSEILRKVFILLHAPGISLDSAKAAGLVFGLYVSTGSEPEVAADHAAKLLDGVLAANLAALTAVPASSVDGGNAGHDGDGNNGDVRDTPDWTRTSDWTLSPTAQVCRGLMMAGSEAVRDVLLQPTTVCGNAVSAGEQGKGRRLIDTMFDFLECAMGSRLMDAVTRFVLFKTAGQWTEFYQKHCRRDDDGAALTTVTERVLTLIFNHWDDPVDRVRWAILDLFDNILKMQETPESFNSDGDGRHVFWASLMDRLVAVPWHVRSKYRALTQLSKRTGAVGLLERFPGLVSQLYDVAADHITAVPASRLISALAASHYSQTKTATDDAAVPTAFSSAWVLPLVACMHGASETTIVSLGERCLPAVAKAGQGVFDALVDAAERGVTTAATPTRDSDGSGGSHATLLTLLSILKLGRHQGLITNTDPQQATRIAQLLNTSAIQACVYHAERRVRLALLAFVCDTKKTTEPSTRAERDLFHRWMQCNLHNQSSAFRKDTADLSLKFLRRAHPVDAATKETPVAASLFASLLRNIAPGVSFQRVNTSLLVMRVCLREAGIVAEIERELSARVWTGCLAKLVQCFCDVAEPNRALAGEVMRLLAQQVPSCQWPFGVDEATDRVVDLCGHMRTIDTDVASALGRLVVDRLVMNGSGAGADAVDAGPGELDPPAPRESRVHRLPALLQRLLDALRGQLDGTLAAPIESLPDHPLHGLLGCVRCALDGMSPTEMRKHFAATNASTGTTGTTGSTTLAAFLSALLDTLWSVVGVVFPVVSSASPEGFVPQGQGADASPSEAAEVAAAAGPDDEQSQVQEQGSPAPPRAHAQAVLVCSWRAMREASLVLGSLGAFRAELGDARVRRIGDRFVALLGAAKHRGAMDMLHLGFLKLCKTLQSKEASVERLGQGSSGASPATTLTAAATAATTAATTAPTPTPTTNTPLENSATPPPATPTTSTTSSTSTPSSSWPQEWLASSLAIVAGTSSFDSITRRSAGLPYLVRALAVVDPTRPRVSLVEATQTLLRLAEPTATEADDAAAMNSSGTVAAEPTPMATARVAQRANALNTLRILIRDAVLGPEMTPVLPEAVVLAISGFSAANFSVRNSAMILFSALMQRIFGVKRVRDELARQNHLTAREFFARFPALHGYFVRRLDAIAPVEGKFSLHPELHPVLVLLSRLHPSPLGPGCSELNMAVFQPFLARCLESPIQTVRVIAARAFAALGASCGLDELSMQLVRGLAADGAVQQNRLHGQLLALQQLVPMISADVAPEFVAGFAGTTQWLCQGPHNPCCVTREAWLAVLLATLQHHSPAAFPRDTLRALCMTLQTQLAAEHNPRAPWSALWRRRLAEVVLRCADAPFEACSLEHVLPLLLSDVDYEVVEAALEVLDAGLSQGSLVVKHTAYVESLKALAMLPSLPSVGCGAVFDVLVNVPLEKVMPVGFVLSVAKPLDTMVCFQALAYAGRLVGDHKAGEEVDTVDVTSAWLDIVLCASDGSRVADARVHAARSLALANVGPEHAGMTPASWAKLLQAALYLLQDDDDRVRSLVANNLILLQGDHGTGCGESTNITAMTTVLPSLCVERVVGLAGQLCGGTAALDLLASWCLGQHDGVEGGEIAETPAVAGPQSQLDGTADAEVVFDRSGVHMFAESTTLAQVAAYGSISLTVEAQPPPTPSALLVQRVVVALKHVAKAAAAAADALEAAKGRLAAAAALWQPEQFHALYANVLLSAAMLPAVRGKLQEEERLTNAAATSCQRLAVVGSDWLPVWLISAMDLLLLAAISGDEESRRELLERASAAFSLVTVDDPATIPKRLKAAFV